MFTKKQQPGVKDAMQLLLQTQVAFARVERNGIKIDTVYLQEAIERTQQQIATLEENIRRTEVWHKWMDLFGTKAALTNRVQLGVVLFDKVEKGGMGLETSEKTEGGLSRVSESSLSKIPGLGSFSADYSLLMSLYKMLQTNLCGIQSALDPCGYIHPSFSIFSVISYRTSSSNPNFQNFPNHNDKLSSIVRRCFVPRAVDRHIVEVDYSGAEVRVNATINHDKTLLASINEGHDFHREIAAMAYMLSPEQVTKSLRSSVKGGYTFAAFYGAHWSKIAKALWDIIVYDGLQLADGTTLLQHINSKGITELGNLENPAVGTYANHIANTFRWFWGEQFQEYAEWKNKNWDAYTKTGYVDTPSGFRCGGVFTRNIVSNIPAQGGAAHCLLWSFCRIDELLREYGFKACLIGQIHDSIVADIPHEELDTVLCLMQDVMTKQLPKHFTWLGVPMEVEADVAPAGCSWYEKKAYTIRRYSS